MKQLFSVLFTLCFVQAFAQISDEVLEMNYEEGQYYAAVKIPILAIEDSIRAELKGVQGYTLVFLPPIYKTRIDTLKLSVQSFYDRMDKSKDTILIEKYYRKTEEYAEPFISTRFVDRNCLSASTDSMIGIEFAEIEAEYGYFQKIIKRTDYENGIVNDELLHPYEYQYIETPYRIIKTTTFNPANYPNIDYLKIIYLKGINWTNFRQILGCGCVGGSRAVTIDGIQKALCAKGFDIPINGILDKRTRAALIKFQKENELPQGRLDVETIKLLEVEKFEKHTIPKKIYEYKDSPRH